MPGREGEDRLPHYDRKRQLFLIEKMISGFWETNWDRLWCHEHGVSSLSVQHYWPLSSVWEHRPLHTVSGRLWQREGPGEEQEVHIWHSSRSQQRSRGGHDPEPHPWERYAGSRGHNWKMYQHRHCQCFTDIQNRIELKILNCLSCLRVSPKKIIIKCCVLSEKALFKKLSAITDLDVRFCTISVSLPWGLHLKKMMASVL